MPQSFAPQRLLHTLPMQIADQIAHSIVDGSFSPGSRLREAELAESFDVSRATIREALRLLEQRGLVRILPQRGAHVTQLSAKELEDLFEVRASLLATGSRLAASQCTDQQAAMLRAYLPRLHATVNELATYAPVSAELVEALMRMSGNQVLADYISDFAQRIGRYVRLGLLTEKRRHDSVATWERIVAAVIAGDGEAAAANHRQLAMDNRSAALVAFEAQAKADADR